MADIFHCLRVSASPAEVLRAVTENELLRPWWSGDNANDNELAVRCLEVDDGAGGAGGAGVAWRCIDGPPEWIGTDIVFAFALEGRETVVRFAHRNWRETNDAFARCTTKWGRILMALKSRVETPEADDLV